MVEYLDGYIALGDLWPALNTGGRPETRLSWVSNLAQGKTVARSTIVRATGAVTRVQVENAAGESWSLTFTPLL